MLWLNAKHMIEYEKNAEQNQKHEIILSKLAIFVLRSN